MPTSDHVTVSPHDRDLLRRLAARLRAAAEHPDMPRRQVLWYEHNALRGRQPLILCFPEGAWGELLPDSALQCTDPKLRRWEWTLRHRLYQWEVLRDDNTQEPYFDLNWRVTIGDFGVQAPRTHGADRGSYVWDPPVKDLDRDLDKLHYRELTVDRAATQRDLDLAWGLFGDLLPPRLRGGSWWTMGLTQDAIFLVGLEQLMLLMYDHPAGLHRLMAFLRDEQMHLITWFEKQGLLTLNNRNDYTGSGGVAYTDELPGTGHEPGVPARLIDRWGFAESQETVGVGPDLFAEFILPYQAPLLEKFGLNCYGCCEPMDRRIDLVAQAAPRMRRVSVAPLANQEVCAAKLGRRMIYSRKPNPAHVCVGFNEPAIRADLRSTLAAARGCVVELVLKDTHTVEGQPQRLARWVEMAREEVERGWR